MTYYLFTDHLGSTVLMASQNSAKNQLESVTGSRATYYPFGDYRGLPPSQTLTDRGFTGQKSNNQPGADLGLLYYNARYYAPGIARFISADTIVPDPAGTQSWNRYSYVNNNPVNYVDPSGHFLCKPGQGICRNPLPPNLNLPLGTGIGVIDWIGKGAIQLGCTVFLRGACEVNGNRLVSTSHTTYIENLATDPTLGMVAPLGMVSGSVSNTGGGIIRKFIQPLMSKLDDFLANTRWGTTWRAMAEAAPNNMLVYQLDDNIAGALYVTRGQNATVLQHTGGNEALNILALEVTTEARGSGIGSELLRAAAQESINMGYGGRLYGYAVDNETAQWLINRGAQIIGEGRLFYFDEATIQALLNP